MSNYKDIMDFIGERVKFDQHGGTYIWGVDKNDNLRMIGAVRGYGAIQHLFEDKKGTIDTDKADAFQDRLGQFIAEAINEKMQRERGLCPDECKHEQVIMVRHAYKCKQCNKVIDTDKS